ncbi:MAG: hypothetical protein ACOCWQ_05735, partial [Nanoarchaeota archaeon]
MIIRHPRGSDVEQIWDAFCTAQVSTASDAPTGFCEYHLPEGAIAARLADQSHVLVLNNDVGRLVSYIIGYSMQDAARIHQAYPDPVLEALSGIPADMIYLDQLYLRSGWRAHHIGQLIDTWEYE